MSDAPAPGGEPRKEPPFREVPQAEEIDLAKVHGSILREHNEPVEGYEAVPFWFVVLIAALVFWGGVYLAMNSGGFRADVFTPSAEPVAANTQPLGQRIFTQNCVVCHQATGQGIPRVFPPLADSEWVLARDGHGDNHLVAVVLHGLQGPTEVNGQLYNGAMPPWKFLRDEEIAAVLTYIRSQWGNAAPPITPEWVGKVRAQTASRAAPWSQSEVRSLARAMQPAPTAAAPGDSPERSGSPH
jgi:mono/diheme cytochrome c family protein